jgi:hypothetical protein
MIQRRPHRLRGRARFAFVGRARRIHDEIPEIVADE